MSHVTTEYPCSLRHAYKLETTKDGTIKNSAAATVAFSCTMKALSLTQSHSLGLCIVFCGLVLLSAVAGLSLLASEIVTYEWLKDAKIFLHFTYCL